MDDARFDELVDELVAREADSPAVTAVGAAVPADSAWPKTPHSIPMGSLDKIQSVDAITGWVTSHSRSSHSRLAMDGLPFEELLVTEKLDGISISVTFDKGRLQQAVTRGDGVVGEAITPNVARMQGILKRLEYDGPVTLRGEIILHKADLARHFPTNSNARNTAAGTAKRLDGKGCEHLNVYFYQVYGPDFGKDADQFLWLERYGFKHPHWYVTAMVPGAKTPQDLWVDYQQTLRDELPYEIDGLVVRFNDLAYQASLGELHGRPRGAVAFKFSPITRSTTSTGLVAQVGGQGRITPVAEVRPVNLLGASVRRASLYNWAYIRQIGFYIGARVTITRSNDVIPRIVAVDNPKAETTPAPAQCPECGSPTEWEGEYLVCPNTAECPAQVEGRLKRWVKELGILEWGDVLIEKVVQEGLATTVAGLYGLSEQALAALERMGPASARKAREQLWSVVPLPLESFLGALGIPLCATSTLEVIVGAGYDSLEALSVATVEQLEKIGGVGPKRAQSFVGWLARNQTLLREMQRAGLAIKPPSKGALTGKSFCFTGRMSEKRPVLEKMVKDAGGQVKKSVGAGLTFLVTSDPESTSGKALAARKNGTACISENQFLDMLA
jgi:DNA ligase (NAD+)